MAERAMRLAEHMARKRRGPSDSFARPADLHDARLRDCLQRLRPFCRDIGFGVDHLELPPAGATAGGGPLTLVIAASALLSGGELREELLFQFIPQIRVRGVRLLVRDVLSLGMARDRREMGVDLIAMRVAEDVALA